MKASQHTIHYKHCPSKHTILLNFMLLLRPSRDAEYCDQPVCLCVCLSVREHISGTAGPNCTKFCVQMPCGRSFVLLRPALRYVMYFGFMDDVTFGRNGRDAETWRLHSAATAVSGVAMQGRSLMSMNACFFCILIQ